MSNRINDVDLSAKDISQAVTGHGKEAKNPKYGGLIENIIPGGGGAASREAFKNGGGDPVDKAKWPGNQKPQ